MSNITYFDLSTMSDVDGPGKRVVVYLQGCNLRCSWCHSPHSQSATSPLLYHEHLCLLCGLCAKACQNEVHHLSDGIHTLNRASCIQCGNCIDACPKSSRMWNSGTLHLPTKTTPVIDLYEQVKPALSLCDGITLSGGEALLQADTVEEFLSLCKHDHIHTAIETSGRLNRTIYQKILPYVDTWLFGLRLVMDEHGEPEWNHIIETMDILKTNSTTEIIPRIPIVPRVTDRKDILMLLSDLMKRYSLNTLWINPWNTSYDVHYIASGIELSYQKPTDEQIKQSSEIIQNHFINHGFHLLPHS